MTCLKHGGQRFPGEDCYDCWLREQAQERVKLKRDIRQVVSDRLDDVILNLSKEQLEAVLREVSREETKR